MQSQLIFLLLVIRTLSASAAGSWLCEEAASIRSGGFITTCGIGHDKDEDKARKAALENAFLELDMVCNRSADCRDFELNINPLRNDCQKEVDQYVCRRAVRAEITEVKKEKSNVAVSTKTSAADNDRATTLMKKEEAVEERATEHGCDYETGKVLGLFADLSSQKKIDDAIRSVKQVPFRKACRNVHFQVIETLDKEKIFKSEYSQFLRSTVKSFGTAEEMADVEAIWEYLEKFGFYDEPLWKDALSTFVRLPKGTGQISRFISVLFQPAYNDSEHVKATMSRLAEVMALAKASKIGRPTPLGPDDAYIEIMEGIGRKMAADTWFNRGFFEKYLESAPTDKPKVINESLEHLFRETKDIEQKKKIIQWMAQNFSRSAVSKISFRVFSEFLERLDGSGDSSGQANLSQNFTSLYVKLNGQRIDEVFSALTERFEIQAATETCLKYDIPCPSLIPNEKSLRRTLTDGPEDKKILALSILEKRPALAVPIESLLYQNLFEEEKRDHRHELISGYINALMRIPTRDPKKIKYLLDLSMDRQVSYEQLISEIGPPATPVIIDIAQNSKHSNQFSAIDMLRVAAKKDPQARKALIKLAEQSTDEILKRSAKEALESMPGR